MDTWNFKYEMFLRKAFGQAENGGMVDQRGDPGRAADAGCFRECNLPFIKCAVGYAMKIYQAKDPGIDDILAAELIADVVAAASVNEIGETIKRFESEVLKN